MDKLSPGNVVLFGSGETSPSGRKVFDQVLRRRSSDANVALLETPAGFELNSAEVAGRVAEFLRFNLQNYRPQTQVIPARKRESAFSPDDPQIVSPLLMSDVIFMGPGSPTYAARQMRGSLAWHMLMARHRLGADLVLASAAAIALGVYALPVYEIYKVGEELHWKVGLDFFGAFGLSLVFVPHFNNQDGGEELDTSRCFMGQSRFARLMELLPPELNVVGIDEKTALLIDLQAGACQVSGLGGVTLLHTGHRHPAHAAAELSGSGLAEVAEERDAHVHMYPNGASFPIQFLGDFRLPEPGAGLPEEVWRQALAAQAELEALSAATTIAIPAEVMALVGERELARARKDWSAADALRLQIAALGWLVKDTPQGPLVEKQ